MSALLPIADMLSVGIDVCLVPKADIHRLAIVRLLRMRGGNARILVRGRRCAKFARVELARSVKDSSLKNARRAMRMRRPKDRIVPQTKGVEH